MKKTDAVLQQDVIDELAAESNLDGSTIGVAVTLRQAGTRGHR